MRKKIKLILPIILIVIIIVIFFNNKKIKENGNLSNMGLCVETDDCVFYNKYEKGIFSCKNGKEKQLTDETAYSINYMNGKLYYLTVENFNNVVIKSVDINGDNMKKIATIYTSMSKIYVDNSYIYFITSDANGGIKRIDLDGNNEELIISGLINDFSVYKNNIYYIDQSGKICKSDINGQNNNVLNEVIIAQRFQIVDSWIYYYYEAENALFRLNTDGKKNEVVSVLVNNETYNISGKYVYYFDKENSKIARMQIDNTNKCDDIVNLQTTKTKINLTNDDLYYLDKSESESQTYQIYRIKLDGKEATRIKY